MKCNACNNNDKCLDRAKYDLVGCTSGTPAEVFTNYARMENKKTLLETMVQALNESNAGFIAAKINGYTIMVTNDDEGAEYLSNAWNRYAEQ